MAACAGDPGRVMGRPAKSIRRVRNIRRIESGLPSGRVLRILRILSTILGASSAVPARGHEPVHLVVAEGGHDLARQSF
jgi:hypothetical protein